MRILHVLDHSIPLQSGYTFRTRNILLHQRALGWETVHVTGIKHKGPLITKESLTKKSLTNESLTNESLTNESLTKEDLTEADLAEEEVTGLHFYRTVDNSLLSQLPVLNQWQVVKSLARRIGEVIEKEKPDVIHAHSPALNGLAALQAAKKYRLPVVYECRAFWEDAAVDHGTSKEFGLRYRLTRALETRVFQKADAVTTICEGLKNEIISRGVPPQKVTVIPNAVDIEHFSVGGTPKPELLHNHGLEGKVVLGFIGSFYAYEGIPLLLEAMPMMVSENPDIRLLLVGGGPQESLIKQQIANLGLEQKVIMTGRVPHEQVQDYYNLVDVFVYPRLSMRLTDLVTPLKPLEAMAQGKLVLASDVGGHLELIENGKTGRLFQANNPESLSREVMTLIKEHQHWPEMRAAGRHFVEEQRNWANSVARYQNIYNGLGA